MMNPIETMLDAGYRIEMAGPSSYEAQFTLYGKPVGQSVTATNLPDLLRELGYEAARMIRRLLTDYTQGSAG